MKIEKYGKYWVVYDEAGELVCVCVYKKGAEEVVKRIGGKGCENRQMLMKG